MTPTNDSAVPSQCVSGCRSWPSSAVTTLTAAGVQAMMIDPFITLVRARPSMKKI